MAAGIFNLRLSEGYTSSELSTLKYRVSAYYGGGDTWVSLLLF